MGKPEVNRPLSRPKSWWDDNIKMDLKEIGGRNFIVFVLLRVGPSGGFCENDNDH
jgi:hypothetical protein